MENSNQLISQSLERVEKWIENHDYKGYEHYDALSSFLQPLTLNNLLAERILTQVVRRCPINLRPLIGINPQESTKGRGYMAAGYLKRFKQTGNLRYQKNATSCLRWLIENKSPGYSNYSWGNHFDYSARAGKLKKFEPIIVWTSLVGQAFLDAYELLNDKKYLDVAMSVCEWILELPRERTDQGTCLSYVMYKQNSIHNSNMLGAAMLARTAKMAGHDAYMDVARDAMIYSCSRQLADGAWYYGEADNLRWIDNFHTGYNLDSLKCYIENSDDNTFKANLDRGFKYYTNTFFPNGGMPGYYDNNIYPIDIQCAAQSIDTLTNFSTYAHTGLDLALKVSKWTIKNMQHKNGSFYYRKLPWITIKTPMLHWGQTTMYKSLSDLLYKMTT